LQTVAQQSASRKALDKVVFITRNISSTASALAKSSSAHAVKRNSKPSISHLVRNSEEKRISSTNGSSDSENINNANDTKNISLEKKMKQADDIQIPIHTKSTKIVEDYSDDEFDAAVTSNIADTKLTSQSQTIKESKDLTAALTLD
jgi:hypothetical protein